MVIAGDDDRRGGRQSGITCHEDPFADAEARVRRRRQLIGVWQKHRCILGSGVAGVIRSLSKRARSRLATAATRTT